ncbi:MAG TPA: PAS domain-containing protein, partial [Leptospiraceae bacterium]|nr:PAS domain-containing protein [Leptospiraceae bacterium]
MSNNYKLNKNKILLIGKDVANYNFLSEFLNKNGYEVRELPENEIFIVFVNSFKPDLILLNIHILDEGLNDFFRDMKQEEIRKCLPILFLNPFNEIQKLVRGYELNFIDCISNHMTTEEILYRIEKLIAVSQIVDKLNQKMSCLGEEVIEHKLNKLIAQEGEERLATILDSVEALIYIKDTEYQYQYANKKLRDLFGKPIDEIINRDDFQFFDNATASHLRENDKQVIAFGKRLAEEEINTGKDNHITTAFLSVKLPLFSENKIVYALCGISTEITKHKQAESELKNALTRLEEQHNQLKETQAQLVQAEKMSGLGTLVAGVAHEVNNPTNYIFISSNTLQTDLEMFRNEISEMFEDSDIETIQYFKKNFDKFERSMSNILDGSERIRMIVQDLKSFSRLDESEKKEV